MAVPKDEMEVLESLAKAYNAFTKLTVMHPSDLPEFVHAIHAAQNIVLAREAIRSWGISYVDPVSAHWDPEPQATEVVR